MSAGAQTLTPDLDRARELAHDANVIPIVHRWVEDAETPVSAFLKLRGDGPCFLLESAEQGGRMGRYSFIGVRPHAVLRWADGELLEWREEAALDPAAPPTAKHEAPDPYAAVAERVGALRLAEVDGLPPFPGGAVGLFAYDLVRTVEPLGEPNPDPLGLPDLALMIAEAMVVFDHNSRELAVIANAFVDGDGGVEGAYARATDAIAEIRERLRSPVPRAPSPVDPAAGGEAPPADEAVGGEGLPPGFSSSVSREQFEATVARIVEYVRAGDAFQVVPSQRFSGPCPVEPFSIYRGLRAVNPSPYMYFLDFGDFQIAGASPEPLVKVTGRRVETRPIAGTYPRGSDAEDDRRRAEGLLADPKERAEHVMLVDLGRNDLGRVSEYGTVSVDELMVVETYSHVLHIVSQVSGRLREGLGAMDVLRSCLPAGTLSGAPKVRAMEIIDELETVKRCSYGGAIGYLSFTGDFDAAIHIRTVVVKDGTAHVQAGGGTVADAKPDYEYRESLQKAQASFKAIRLAADHPEWE
ncbi:MAG TPA: anthranilate synthase component I [Solirubrobacterales bacterium]|nr:anthranilate synthase component I [Solirubrobacterales bacterium]